MIHEGQAHKESEFLNAAIMQSHAMHYQACTKRGGLKGPRARARALAKFTPIHHWEEGELQLGLKRNFLGKCISGRFCMTLEQNNLLGV